MKTRILYLLSFLLVATSAWAWKPIFAGHRGSYRGVSNTEEAFINGVDFYHYTGLECDVRVTKDGEYVILHDETTASLCETNLTVADATLAELEALTLTQTRSGNTYTGKICTVSRFLEICVEKNVFPIIELKWATGINNNDMSNFAGLLALVDEYGLREKAIFLTSMNKSIAHIKDNYPDLTCQYLLSSDSDTKFEFCKTYKVNPSFSAGALTQGIVNRYRTAGFEVAVWTVNTEENYKKYGDMGCFMMTCDYLRPNDMPELEQPADLKPREDAVKINAKVLWTRSAKGGNLPANYPSKAGDKFTTGQQAAVSGGKFYVNDYGTKTLLVMDQTCSAPTELPYSETELGGSAAYGITTDDAENIIQRFEDSSTASPSKLRLFKKGTTTEPVIVEFSLEFGGQNNFLAASGDVFSEAGGYVYFFPNKQTTVSILHIVNGELKEVITHGNTPITGSTASVVIPVNGPECYAYMVRNVGYYLYDNEMQMGSIITGASTTQPDRNSSLGGAIMMIDGHRVLAHMSGVNYNGGFTLRDIDADNSVLESFPPLGTDGFKVNASVGTFMKPVKVAEGVYHLYCYTMGNGYGVYEISSVNAGLEDVVIDNQCNAPVEWYNLQGMRVDGDNLGSGIYIRRQGSKTEKVKL